MLAILDYEAGNQTSVSRALTSLGIANRITADPAAIAASAGVIFPGVGAAGQAMGHLCKTGMDALLHSIVAENKPLLGICLGCQIMLSRSEENATTTLGILPGETKRFAAALRDENGEPIRIPHMGWNTVTPTKHTRLFDGIGPQAEFYFVHSYYVEPDPQYTLATTQYGMEFCSVFGRDGLWAVQFHTEKSGRPGLKLLHNFYDYCREKNHVE